MKEHIDALYALFQEHHDIVDSGGDGHVTPRPNWAMRCSGLLDEIDDLIPDGLKSASGTLNTNGESNAHD